jgi:hypothetical protein
MRLLAGTRPDRALSLAEHLAVHGPLRPPGPELVDSVDASGLTGRGGGAFPLARKMRTAAAGRRRPVVVVNAAESEPASEKDAWLAARTPHLVIDGAVAAATSIGAREIVLWVHRGATAAVAALTTALEERYHLADAVPTSASPKARTATSPARHPPSSATSPAVPRCRPCRRTGRPSAASTGGRRCSPTPRRSPTSR